MPNRTKKSAKKHVLVLRFSAMGDVAMTVPVIKAAVTQYPDLRITVATRGQFRPFFDNIERVSFYEVNFNKRHKGFFGLLRLYKELRLLHITAVADLHNVLRTRVIDFLFRRRGKQIAVTNKMREARKQLTAATNKLFEPLPPVAQLHADVFAELGLPVTLNTDAFKTRKILSDDITSETGLKEGRWIGIAPFAQHRTKVYPKDLMQQVIDRLAALPDTKLFLFGGGGDEKKLLNKFAGDKPNVVVIPGKRWIMKQELQVISNLDVMLSMDSGNGHMAAMYGVKVVNLWGATHPYAGFAPFNQPLSNSLTVNREQYPLIPTSVYGNKDVPGYEDAMRTITPQMVIDKLEQVLKQ